MYVRGRLKEVKWWCFAHLIKEIIRDDTSLEWFIRDRSETIWKIGSDSNFSDILSNSRATDALDVATFLRNVCGTSAIDVGANRGYLSVILSRQFDVVFSFEPDIDNRQQLEETLRSNSVNNVFVYSEAISSKSGTLELRVSSDYGHHTLESTHLSEEKSKIEVTTIRLDEFLSAKGLDSISLLKIDVEGHELEVLRGAGALLIEKRIDQILFEHSPVLNNLQERGFADVFQYLTENGYAVETLSGELVSPEMLLDFGQCDLVAKPMLVEAT
jgi:FkbM family methyltransferase